MQALVVFEDEGYRDLLPLTYWRTTAELRCGYVSLLGRIRDKLPDTDLTLYCRPMLSAVAAERSGLPVNVAPEADQTLLVNARLLLTSSLQVSQGPAVQWHEGAPLVIQTDRALLDRLTPEVLLGGAAIRQLLARLPEHRFIESPQVIRYPWDLVNANRELLESDWRRADAKVRPAGKVHDGAHLRDKKAIHIGEGSRILPGAVLDATAGPIYIGENVTVSSHAVIEGPCFIGERSLIRPGAHLHDGVTIGPRCKIGGEVEASVFQGYANKQHSGFLGHAYIAEWVNLGAGTINSDLKNTYGTVRVPINGVEIDSGEMVVGATIGDHSKTGIGQLLPTGAVIGFGSSVAVGGLTPKFVPSFAWLTQQGSAAYDIDRALDVARRVMARREVTMTPAEEELFRSIVVQAGEREAPAGPC